MKLVEVENNSAAFVFGRFNPPTLGHKKLFDQLKTVSDVRFVFVSHTQDKKKNPLSWNQKVSIMSAQFPEMADYVISDPNIKTIIDVMKFLETAGHKSVIMVAGSDRVKSFEELLNKYNGKEYNFDSIRVHSAGLRDPDADSLEGVSASKAREAAVQGDFDGFATMFAGTDGLKKQIYDAVRKGMGVKESLRNYIDNVVDEQDFFGGDNKFADEEGNSWNVKKVNDFVTKNKAKYLKKNFPVSKIAHNLKWWQGDEKRMMNTDTSFPLLVLQEPNGNLSVADGLNRLKKIVSVEKKNMVDVYLVPKQDIMNIKEEAAGVGIVTKQNTTKDVNKKTLGKIMKALHLK